MEPKNKSVHADYSNKKRNIRKKEQAIQGYWHIATRAHGEILFLYVLLNLEHSDSKENIGKPEANMLENIMLILDLELSMLAQQVHGLAIDLNLFYHDISITLSQT